MTFTSSLLVSSLRRLREFGQLEPIQVLTHLLNKLLSFALPLMLFCHAPVGFYEGWQVRRGEVLDPLGVGAPFLKEIDASLLCQVSIQELLSR